MQFNEPTFLLLFLPAFLACYFLLPSARNGCLLLGSLFFAAWASPEGLPLLLLACVVNYALGLFVARRRGVLIAGLFANLFLLIVCKYATFLHLPLPRVPAPPGLSFFTFVAIAYLIDVYRGAAPAVRNPVQAGNMFLLFPKLLAGPITRPSDIGPALAHRTIDAQRFAYGVRRFIIGLGKKVVIATSAGAIADSIFALPVEALRTDLAWLGVIAYTVQIYHDFSGYTDMAIGLGAMLGFTLPENFNYPYAATSIRDFWRRWHMTLSGWLRDYLYIPLGGSRCAPWRAYTNLIVVFLICGVWHGANWTFVAWGGLQGLLLLAERACGNRDLPRPLGHVYALLATMVSWVFFRAATMGQAGGFLRAMFGLARPTADADGLAAFVDPLSGALLVAGLLVAFPILCRLRLPEPLPTLGYLALFAVALVMAAVNSFTPFIYQQF